MSDSTTSLDRLHDLALPPEVSWWPLAQGWIVLLCIVALLLVWAIYRSWKNWRANAYRRAALSALESAADVAAVAALLRRTALAIAPRAAIAEKSGRAWLDWLAAQSPLPLSEAICTQLTVGLYGRPSSSSDLTELRTFAAGWINHHHLPPA